VPDATDPDYPAARDHRDSDSGVHLWNAGAYLDDADGEELGPKDLGMAQAYAMSAVAAAIREQTAVLTEIRDILRR